MADQEKLINGKKWYHDVRDVFTSQASADMHVRTLRGYAFVRDTKVEEMTDGTFWVWYRM